MIDPHDRRNPYVILGLRFGASGSEARRGLARGRRKLKGMADAPFSQEDLTWAEHFIEHIIEDPDVAFDVYRIPAVLTDEPTGLFKPPPHRLERTTPIGTEEQWEELRRSAIAKRLRSKLSELISPDHTTIPYN